MGGVQESEGLARGLREACIRGNVVLPPELDNPSLAARNEAALTAAARLRALDGCADGASPDQPDLGNGQQLQDGAHHDGHGSSSSSELDQVRCPASPAHTLGLLE